MSEFDPYGYVGTVIILCQGYIFDPFGIFYLIVGITEGQFWTL